MTRDYQVNLRRITISGIRVYAAFQFIKMLYGLFALLWYLYNYSTDIAKEASIYQDLKSQVLYMLINSAVLFTVYFQAARISGWMFAEDEPIVWSGDPFELALPAIQILGLVFLTMGFSRFLPVIQTFYLHQQGSTGSAFEPKFWDEVWSVFLHLLLGFLFFRNPRWLVNMMKHFSKEAH